MFSDQGLHLRPFVYPFTATTNRESFKRDYHEDRTQPYPLRFFVRGYRYQLLFVLESDIHLFGTGVAEVPVHLLGTDHLGRDMLARVMYGAQISLSVGLVGVAISFILGILIGGMAGYFGGFVDEAVQRVVEVLLSIPQLPLWMGLSAALPLSWPVVRMYFAITVILSLVGWTRLAREVRGKFLSLRRRGLRGGRTGGRDARRADHLSPHGALLPEPHRGVTDAQHPADDHRRDLAVVPGPGHAGAGDQLGRAAAERAEGADAGAGRRG